VSLLELRLVELLLSERKRNGSSLICIYKYNAASIRSSTSDQIFCTSRQLLITLITHSRRIDRKKLAQLHHRVADPSPIESERKKKLLTEAADSTIMTTSSAAADDVQHLFGEPSSALTQSSFESSHHHHQGDYRLLDQQFDPIAGSSSSYYLQQNSHHQQQQQPIYSNMNPATSSSTEEQHQHQPDAASGMEVSGPYRSSPSGEQYFYGNRRI